MLSSTHRIDEQLYENRHNVHSRIDKNLSTSVQCEEQIDPACCGVAVGSSSPCLEVSAPNKRMVVQQFIELPTKRADGFKYGYVQHYRMNLNLEFLNCLLKNGYSKRDIRITVSPEAAKTIKVTSKISNELNINRGTLHRMKEAKRRVPLDIAEYFGIKYTENLSPKNSNIEIKVPKFLSNDLAYLCGVLRDGTVTREGKNEYTVAFYSKSKEF